MVIIKELEEQLSDFNQQIRKEALKQLRSLDKSEIYMPAQKGIVNVHMHTFFSYNYKGWSPYRCLWEALKQGIDYVGLVEFDVLHGLEESLEGGLALNIPAVVGIETRVFVPELANVEINSPGEPGISYAMGHGFYKLPEQGSKGAKVLEDLFIKAQARNKGVMERVNHYLGKEASIDYEKDVLVLTPNGNATERHMVQAYAKKAEQFFEGNEKALINYWAEKLKVTHQEVENVIKDKSKFYGFIREKIMKKGGVGYMESNPENFPHIKAFFDMVRECGALPTATWLDGTKEGEKDPERLLNIYQKKYKAVLLNIIPHRNYPNEVLYKNLQAIVDAARKKDILLSIGTELNKPGQPFVDDFFNKWLAPYRQLALDGAKAIYHHTQEGLKSK